MVHLAGQVVRLSHFVVVQDRVFPREAAERLSCSTRTIQRWNLPKDAQGKVSFRLALQRQQSQRTGRRPGRQPKTVRELLAQLSPKERDLVEHYLKPDGLRKLERTMNAVALTAQNWRETKRKRWSKKLRAGADAVERAQPTGARERQRKAAAQRCAYREDQRRWKKGRNTVEDPKQLIVKDAAGQPVYMKLTFHPSDDSKLIPKQAEYYERSVREFLSKHPRDAFSKLVKMPRPPSVKTDGKSYSVDMAAVLDNEEATYHYFTKLMTELQQRKGAKWDKRGWREKT
jgi:hypothetical protein